MTNLKTKLVRGVLITEIACLAAAMASADPGNYNQQGPKLVGSGQFEQRGLYSSLSADGNTALIGGSGGVLVFTRSNGIWAQQQQLTAEGAVNGPPTGLVALSGDGNTAVLGGKNDNSEVGAVWVFIRSNGVWTQQGSKLVGTGAVGNAAQGSSVAVSADGNTLVEGGPQDHSGAGIDNSGAAWVFTRSGGVWTQQGSKLVGAANIQGQGLAVTISADGDTMAENSSDEYTPYAENGIFVFTRSNGVWTQQGGVLSVNPNPVGGVNLSGDGNTLLAAGYFFYRKNGVWSQEGSGLFDSGVFALSLDAGTVAVGHAADNYVAVYVQTGGVWTLHHEYTGRGNVSNAFQGSSVALSANGNTMLEGGPSDDNSIGAAWIFASPELSTSLTHAGNFTQGQTGATYTISVKNVGDRDIHAAPTSAAEVVDELPAGLSATAMYGMGWSCDITTLTCTRDDGLAVGDSFPPVTVTVRVASNAPSSVTNVAIAKGGGSTWGTAKDVTTILP